MKNKKFRVFIVDMFSDGSGGGEAEEFDDIESAMEYVNKQKESTDKKEFEGYDWVFTKTYGILYWTLGEYILGQSLREISLEEVVE